MAHYDIDIYCKGCGGYMYSTFNPKSKDEYCDECERKWFKEHSTPLEYFIKGLEND